jgi:hypothetical protein
LHRHAEWKEFVMKTKRLLFVSSALLSFGATASAQAYECPKHFAQAWAAIEEVAENMNRAEGVLPKEDLIVPRSHLRNARISYVEGQHHHKAGRHDGDYHHARAIVRANEAHGHAAAAGSLLSMLINR